MSNLFNDNVDSLAADNLFHDTKHPADIKGVTILTGQGALVRGTVVGIITATGKGKLVDSANADGSQVADCILTDDVDTTTGDVVTSAYISGSFNRKALVFGGTDDASDHEAALREKGIFLKDNISY